MPRLFLHCLLSIVLGTAVPAASAVEDWVAQEMGLPQPSASSIEIRVWIEHALIEPRLLYRLRESNGVVTAEHYVWLREARDDAAAAMLQQHGCRGQPVHGTTLVTWCLTPAGTKDDWTRVYRALPLERMWKLPQQRDLKLHVAVKDGSTVTLELSGPAGKRRIVYDEPQACADAAPACQVMATVQQLLSSVR